MEYATKLLLIDPRNHEQLLLDAKKSQPVEGCGNILNRNAMPLDDDGSHCRSKPSFNNILRHNYDKTCEKNTCSTCGRTFARRINYRRHLALIHRIDISGNSIDDTTFHRYKSWNVRCADRHQETRKHDNETYFNSELDRLLNMKEEEATRLRGNRIDNHRNVVEKKTSVKEQSKKMRMSSPVQSCAKDKSKNMIHRKVKTHIIGTKSVKEQSNKKPALSPEQRRARQRTVLKTWLAY